MIVRHTPIMIIGNISHDVLVARGERIKKCLGGSAAYMSNVFLSLNIPHSVISYVGYDFKYLYDCPFFPYFCKKNNTTTFINFTYLFPRKQMVINCGSLILPEDVKFTADIGIVCGIINEVLPATIKKMRVNTQILIADIQGFIRSIQDSGMVRLSHISSTIYSEVIFLFDFIKVNEEELKYINLNKLIRKNVKVLVTMADKGCILYLEKSPIYIPTLPIFPLDSTGAGDTFLGGFVAGLYKQFSVENSVKLGHSCAKIAIKNFGIPNKECFTNLNLKKVC